MVDHSRDDWGPALDGPKQGKPPDPAIGSAPSVCHIPLRSNSYSRPLGEDPVYLAALQQAASASGVSPSMYPPLAVASHAPSSASKIAKPKGSKRAGRYEGGAPPHLASALAAANNSAAATSSSNSNKQRSTRGGEPGPELSSSSIQGFDDAAYGVNGADRAGAGPGSVPGASVRAALKADKPGRSDWGRGGASKQQVPDQRWARPAGQCAVESAPKQRGRQENAQTKQQQQVSYLQHQQQQGAQKASERNKERSARFPEYLPQEQLQIMFKRGLVFRGRFRVNASNRREAYISVPGLPHDCMLRGERAQNRAMEGDEVAVQLLPVSGWNTNFSQLPEGADQGKLAVQDEAPWHDAQTPEQALAAVAAAVEAAPPGALRICGQVVSILEPSIRREQLVGIIQAGAPGQMAEGYRPHFFLPLALTMPRCVVTVTSVNELPEELLAEAAQPAEDGAASRTLISARFLSWGINDSLPLVELRQSLGQAGEIESETAAILEIEGIRHGDFSPEVEACLPPTPWAGISDEELKHRRDYRSAHVFSIDPPTAKDLDDAMHVEPVEGAPGRWRVGVHIADVSHFIPPDSALDDEAQERATSVYLVQRVIPMLPRLLCEELCSLNPGTPRYAFSVEWELDEAGRIYSHWVGKSVICSSAKLAYPMVQAMIEGRFNPAECPAQLYGDQPWHKIINDCLVLHKIAQSLRAGRFASGAVRLDNVRIAFGLDKDGNPMSCGQYVQQDANKLVEEFMLLANISVAKIISSVLPDRAMLRNHVPPLPNKIQELLATCQCHSIDMDASSAGALQASLNSLRETCNDQGVIDVVTMLVTKPMQLAKYFCTGDFPDPELWRHYALALPEYTHFTSPIRRYPDLIVHRLLSAALEIQQQREQQQAVDVERIAQRHKLMDTRRTTAMAKHCNEKRLTARSAQDASLKLYLCCLLRRSPVVTEAIVSSVGGKRFFDVYLTKYGMSTRIQVEQLGVDLNSHWDNTSRTLTLQPKSNAGLASNGSIGSSTGGRKGFGYGPVDKKQQQDNGMPLVDYGTWLAELPALSNPEGLSAVSFPLTIKMFQRLPVIATSPLCPGKISQLVCRLLLHPEIPAATSTPPPPPENAQPLMPTASAPATPAAVALLTANAQAGSAGVPPEAAAAAAAGTEEARDFCIPYAELFND